MKKIVACLICLSVSPLLYAQTLNANAVVFSDPALGINSDNTVLYRSDLGADYTRLRLQLGDEESGLFEVGYPYYTNGQWRNIFTLDGSGNGYFKGNVSLDGDLVVGSANGNKQIFTWSGGDQNWRIGMSASPGFTRSLVTAHTQYVTYSTGDTQGFAVGINGGESGFEVRANGHQAFFRGNVGIGTTSTTARLNIWTGTANAGDNSVKIEAPNIGNLPSHIHWGTTGDWYVRSASNAGKVILQDQGGNVGIGTGSPGVKVDIAGGGGSNTDLRVNGRIQTGDANNLGGIWVAQSGMFVGQRTATAMGMYNNGLWRLVVENNGNVGIGTLTPNKTLTVNGTIYGKEVLVDLNVPGPDYVFEKDYHLPTLDQVQMYIEKNKHLPEVPSASEMEANGINVAEMNIILLKKVEELTLYLIEQSKNVDRLTEQNQIQFQEIESLKKQVNKLMNK